MGTQGTDIGAYHAWAAPIGSYRKVIGEQRIAVTVLDRKTLQPATGMTVRIRLHHEHGTRGFATALNTPAEPSVYVAAIKLDEPGRWDAYVELDGPLGEAEIALPGWDLAVPQPVVAGYLVFGIVLGAIGGGALYLIRSAMRPR